MKKGFLLILSVALVVSQFVLYPLLGSAAGSINFSNEKEGQYNPLHPYILNWYGDVLINGGLNLSEMKLTTTSNTADVVMTTSGYIGASGIVELGTNVDLKAPIDSSQYVGKWKTYVDLKATTYLLRTHDDKYAKIRINDILPGKALFTYVLQSDSPNNEIPIEQKETKYNINPKHMWTISFSKAVNANSINKNTIYVLSSTGRIIDTRLEVSSNGTKVFVHPPATGYTPSETYALYISNTISEKSSTTTLKSKTQMKFIIAGNPPIDIIAPNAPTNVSIITDGDFYLNWTKNNESDLAGYFVYYSLTGSNYVRLANDAGGYLFTTNNISLNQLKGSKIYIYVTAVDKSGNESTKSNTVTATLEVKDIIPPAAPTNVSIIKDGDFYLNWTKNSESDLAGYFIYYSLDGTNFVKSTNNQGGYLFTTNTISLKNFNGSKVFIYVTAIDKSGNESTKSNTVTATLEVKDTIPPAVPTGVTAKAIGNKIQIDWYENYELDLLGYYLYVSEGSPNNFKRASYGDGQSLIVETNVDFLNLKNGTTYYFYLTAVDKNYNESAPSKIVFATPTSSSNTNWSGTWTSTWGNIQFTQSGSNVTGIYPAGTLNGTVEGNTITGTYYENSWSYGTFIFTMSNDGMSFDGKSLVDGGYYTVKWNGIRLQ